SVTRIPSNRCPLASPWWAPMDRYFPFTLKRLKYQPTTLYQHPTSNIQHPTTLNPQPSTLNLIWPSVRAWFTPTAAGCVSDCPPDGRAEFLHAGHRRRSHDRDRPFQHLSRPERQPHPGPSYQGLAETDVGIARDARCARRRVESSAQYSRQFSAVCRNQFQPG